MADEKKEPQTWQERTMESGMKAVEKATKDKVASKLQQGSNPQQILQELLSSVGAQGPSQQNLLQQLMGISETQIPSGERMGLGRSLISGHGFDRPEYTEPVGLGKAIQVMGLQQQMAQQQRQVPQEQVKLLLDLQKLLKPTPAKEQYEEQRYQEKLTGIPTGGLPPATPEALESFRGEGVTGGILARERKAFLSMKEAEARIKAKQEVFKTTETQRAAMSNIVSMFSNVVAQVKGAEEEQGGLGLQQGARGLAGVFLRDPKFARTSAAYGQRVETALRMNRILTGQNRIIRSVVEMVLNSLPDRFDPDETVSAKIAQSIKNSYMISKGWEKAAMTPEEIKNLPSTQMNVGGKKVDVIDVKLPAYSLNAQEEAELEKIIQEVLATPAAKARKLGRNSFATEEEASKANLKPGTRININGRPAIWE